MSKLVEIIAQDIAGSGVISFARFMELALYCPVYGYYETEEDTIGRHGDYYTSPSVGPLFGQLLACQFAEWCSRSKNPGPKSPAPDFPTGGPAFQLIEAGAHRGELARDILDWMRRQQPELFADLEYWIVEPSERRRRWQQQTLTGFSNKVHWTHSLARLDPRLSTPGFADAVLNPKSPCRIIFSNELLDALPVHRLAWDATRRVWSELGVGFHQGRFVWTKLAEHLSRLPPLASLALPEAQFSGLWPDGFTIEICPAALDWWRDAAARLGCGRLVTFDYGLRAEQLFVPERREGTLRAYRHHRLSSDVLASPGQQDLTAHVNFTALQTVGETAGLKTEDFLTQEQFLTRLAARIWNHEVPFDDWTPDSTRQFQTLTHPEHLGRAFRVLVQSRNSA